MKWALVLLACAGCDHIFGVHRTHLTDAYIPDGELVPLDAPDGDGDGIADYSDNCPKVANADQADFDQDGVGDACDTCPLIASPRMGADLDGDGIPDVCDPHPTEPADPDCLVLFDRFSDEADLTTNWLVAGSGSATVVGPSELAVKATSGTVTMYEKSLAGTFALQLQGQYGMPSFTPISASTVLVTQGSGTDGVRTAVDPQQLSIEVTYNNGSASGSGSGALSGPRPNSAVSFLARLAVDLHQQSYPFVVFGRVDQAALVGAARFDGGSGSTLPIGQTGIEVSNTNVTIQAFVAYSQPMSGTCPTPVIR